MVAVVNSLPEGYLEEYCVVVEVENTTVLTLRDSGAGVTLAKPHLIPTNKNLPQKIINKRNWRLSISSASGKGVH